jgi:hypothetical protein
MDSFSHPRELNHLVDDLRNHLLIEDEAKEFAVFENVPLSVVFVDWFAILKGGDSSLSLVSDREGTIFVDERISHSWFQRMMRIAIAPVVMAVKMLLRASFF